MKKLKKGILGLLLLICLMYFGCNQRLGLKYRFDCHGHDVKLGTIDFSKEMKAWEVEASTEKIVITSLDETINTIRIQKKEQPLRFRAYKLCTGLDFLAPSYAYAYYEYENIPNTFSDLVATGINIHPVMTEENGERVEYIYVGVGVYGFHGIVGLIPVTKTNKKSRNPPILGASRLFKFHGNMKIGDRSYEDIWVCEREFKYGINTSKIYYSKSEGIVSFKLEESIEYIREINGHNPNEKIFYVQKIK